MLCAFTASDTARYSKFCGEIHDRQGLADYLNFALDLFSIIANFGGYLQYQVRCRIASFFLVNMA